MLATNFEEKFIPKINQILKFVLENKHSDFYRKKYGKEIKYPIHSFEDFEKISALSKNEFLAYAVADRTFIPKEEVSHYSFSSGTTGHTIPTIIPHSWSDPNLIKKYTLNEKRFRELGVSKIIVLSQPMADLYRKLLIAPDPSVIVIPGDIHNLKISAYNMQALCAEGILAPPTILDFFIEELKAINFDFSTVRWISMGSEFCSTLRYNYFRSQFPNAFFHMRYGNSEIGGTPYYRCEHMAKNSPPNIFHIKEGGGLIQIVDENNQTLPFGETGEIIYTEINQVAFPLIRYKMKDMASFSNIDCPCGNKVVLKFDGRADFDIFKIHGLTIHAELISQAVGKIQDVVELRHQMHVYEEIINKKPKLKLQLDLKLRPAYADSSKNEIFIAILKEKISTNLQLSGKMTLAELVNKGIILPLEIKFITLWPQNVTKTRNIISHIQ